MDMSNYYTVVPAIAVISGLVGYASKQVPSIKDNYIPVIVGIVGGILGVIGIYVLPEYPVKDILDAIALGIESGLASTGAHQIVKQIKKG